MAFYQISYEEVFKMDELEKQILKNQIEIMGFLNGLRTTIINLSGDKEAIEFENGVWFEKEMQRSKELLE